MNRDDIIDLLTVIAAIDHRTAGQTDINVWYDLIGDLPRELAMQATRDHFREEPGVYLEPGHIYQRVRAIKRDIAEREYAAEERAAIDAKVAAIAAEVAAKRAIPGADPQPRVRNPHDPRRVPCGYCHASAGSPCIAQSTHQPMRQGGQRYHPSRIDAAMAPAQPAEDAAWPFCGACHKRPLITNDDVSRGVCRHCRQAATPRPPKTKAAEWNGA